MPRWLLRGFLALLGVCLLTALLGAIWQSQLSERELAAAPPPGRLVDIGGYRLHLWCVGVGEPTVLLESGLGGNALDWSLVTVSSRACQTHVPEAGHLIQLDQPAAVVTAITEVMAAAKGFRTPECAPFVP